VPILEE